MRLRVPRWLARPQRRLRTKLSLLLGLIALLACVVVAALTYYLARDALVDQRTSEARERALIDAERARDQLRSGRDGFAEFLSDRLTPEDGGFVQVIARVEGELVNYAEGSLQLSNPDILPATLRAAVADGSAASQRFSVDGDRYIAVGVPLPDVGAEFYEALPMGSTEATLRRVLLLLTAGSGVAVLLAGAGGIWAGRRVLRPLGDVVEAAEHIASGDLRTRVSPQTDADLEPLVVAFNGMADAVQQRIEREARFASDVSHELRSPITALRAATDLIDKRREEIPERTRQIVDVIVTQVRRFDGMVLDLLELARMDAGAADVHLERVDVVEVLGRIVARLGVDVPIVVNGVAADPGLLVDHDRRDQVPGWSVRLDRLRFDRIVANLVQNAEIHGGGATAITVSAVADDVAAGSGSDVATRAAAHPSANGDRFVDVAVEDAGPGVDPAERLRIFERYARGSESRHRVGTGLGLALVAEHARVIGGTAWVEPRSGGGARFVVRLRQSSSAVVDDEDDEDDKDER